MFRGALRIIRPLQTHLHRMLVADTCFSDCMNSRMSALSCRCFILCLVLFWSPCQGQPILVKLVELPRWMDDIVTVTGSQLMVVTQYGSSKGHFKGLCPPYGRQIADDDDYICRRVLRKIRERSVCRLPSATLCHICRIIEFLV